MKIDIEPKGLVRKIEKIPQIYKALVIVVIVLAIVGALYYFIAVPQKEEREKLSKEQTELEKEVAVLRGIEKNLEKHRKEYAQMQEVLKDVTRQLPESKDVPNLLRSITAESEESRLKVKFFEPKDIRSKEFYGELPFEIKYSGTFPMVAHFFNGIRKMERIVNIANFSLESKSGQKDKETILEGTCSAVAYVYQKEGAKGAKGKTGQKGGKDEKK